jgi:hypothetical protein
MVIESDLTPFEKAIFKNLLAAQEKLHTQVDRLSKFDCLYKILSYCRSLKLDPLPYLKNPQSVSEPLLPAMPDYSKTERAYGYLHCLHCDFKTNKGEMSMRAHVGRVHKDKKS